MELRLALLGGVVPATILGVCLLLGGCLGRVVERRHRSSGRTVEGGASGAARPLSVPRAVGWAWLAGAALAVPWIHFATWGRPEWWPVSATSRFVHVAGVLIAWCVVEMLAPRRTPAALRWAGRFVVVAGVTGMLLHAYLRVLGWGTVVSGSLGAAALVVVATLALVRGQGRYHPWAAMSAVFVAAVGAVPVLILGRTATAAQASAGVAALAAATGVASILSRRSAPSFAAAFVLSGLLAWLLAIGCFGTGKTNLASSALLLLAPLGWAVPVPKIDLFWKKLAPGWIVGVGWSLVCVGAAVAIAVLTQDAPQPEYGY